MGAHSQKAAHLTHGRNGSRASGPPSWALSLASRESSSDRTARTRRRESNSGPTSLPPLVAPPAPTWPTFQPTPPPGRSRCHCRVETSQTRLAAACSRPLPLRISMGQGQSQPAPSAEEPTPPAAEPSSPSPAPASSSLEALAAGMI